MGITRGASMVRDSDTSKNWHVCQGREATEYDDLEISWQSGHMQYDGIFLLKNYNFLPWMTLVTVTDALNISHFILYNYYKT